MAVTVDPDDGVGGEHALEKVLESGHVASPIISDDYYWRSRTSWHYRSGRAIIVPSGAAVGPVPTVVAACDAARCARGRLQTRMTP